jgi:hypothetical protein
MAYNSCKSTRAGGPSAGEYAAYEEANPPVEKAHSHRPQKRAPSARKAQELTALLQGPTQANNGEALLRTFGQLATERMLPEA